MDTPKPAATAADPTRRLEHSIRIWKLTTVLVMVMVAGIFAALQTGSASVDEAHAGKFVLLDGDGTQRAVLGCEEDGTVGLRLVDPVQKKRVAVELDKDGVGALTVFDSAGRLRCSAGANAEGVASVVLNDANGTTRVSVGVEKDGIPGIYICDAQGHRRIKLNVTDEGEPGVLLYGPTDELLGALAVDEDARLKLQFYGKAGEAAWSEPK